MTKESIEELETKDMSIVYIVCGICLLPFVLVWLRRYMRKQYYKKQSKFKNFVITNILIVLCIEITQLLTASGSCDIDDIILNTTGILIGALLYFGVKRLKNRKNRIR